MSKAAQSNATQIREPEPSSIEPPDGWQLTTEWGFMAFDDSPASRLVRLADIVWWLMKTRQLPRVRALQVLSEPIERGELMSCLYELDRTDYAKLVPPDSMFGYLTAQQQVRRQRKSDESFRSISGIGSQEWHDRFDHRSARPRRPFTDEAQPGAPALIQRLSVDWSTPARRPGRPDPLDGRNSSTALAVPIERAFAWWGYGRSSSAVIPMSKTATEFASLVNRPKGVPWTSTELAVLLEEFDRRMRRAGATKSAVCEDIGNELGRTRPSVQAQVDKALKLRGSGMPTSFRWAAP